MRIIGSSIVVVFVALLWLVIARSFGVLDKPGRDISARKPVPTIQGIFLCIGLILSVLIWLPEYATHPKVRPFLVGTWALMILFAVDEWLSLWKTNRLNLAHLVDVIPSRVKLVLQLWILLFVIVLTWLGEREIEALGIMIQVPIRLWTLFTLGWFILFINAINWFDYAYGQASGLSFLGFVTIVILVAAIVLPYYTWISPENYEVLQIVLKLSILLAIISLVYTMIEYKPHGLLRDAWVMIYGFALAYLSLLWWAKIGTIMVALSLPILDAIWVVCHRIFVMRKSPLSWDYTHLHHRLLALGWTKTELRWFVRLWSIVMMALILLQWTNRMNKIIIFVIFAAIYLWVNSYVFRAKGKHKILIQTKKG